METSAFRTKKMNIESYLRGFARLFDPVGLLNEKYRSYDVFDKSNGSESDRMNIYSDWQLIGADIKSAIEKFSENLND